MHLPLILFAVPAKEFLVEYRIVVSQEVSAWCPSPSLKPRTQMPPENTLQPILPPTVSIVEGIPWDPLQVLVREPQCAGGTVGVVLQPNDEALEILTNDG